MYLIRSLGLCFFVLACGRKDKDESKDIGNEQVKHEDCVIDLMPDGEVIFKADDGENPKSITQVNYRFKESSIGCYDFAEVEVKNLKFDIKVKSKPMPGYLYDFSLGESNILFLPDLNLKGGDISVDIIEAPEAWKGKAGDFRSIRTTFEYPQVVENSNDYPTAVIIKIFNK